MVKCARCQKRYGLVKINDNDRENLIKYGSGNRLCVKCVEELNKEHLENLPELKEKKRKELEEAIAKAPKIQCPFCKQWFPKLTNEQYRDGAELNVLKWLIVPAWGLAGSLKNKPYIECPHCKMKIMQG